MWCHGRCPDCQHPCGDAFAKRERRLSSCRTGKLWGGFCQHLSGHGVEKFRQMQLLCGETLDYAVNLGIKGILFVADMEKFIKVSAVSHEYHSLSLTPGRNSRRRRPSGRERILRRQSGFSRPSRLWSHRHLRGKIFWKDHGGDHTPGALLSQHRIRRPFRQSDSFSMSTVS